MEIVIVGVVVLIVGFAAGYLYYRNVADKKVKSAEAQADEIITKAEARSKELDVQAKEEALQLRNEAEQEITRKRRDVDRQEERLQNIMAPQPNYLGIMPQKILIQNILLQ